MGLIRLFVFFLFPAVVFAAPRFEFFEKTDQGQLIPTSEFYFGAQLVVRVSGLSQRSYGIHCRRGDAHSKAVIRPNAQGIFQSDRQWSSDGTYLGVDPDGFFWSMAGPMDFKAPYTFSLEWHSQEITSATLPWKMTRPNVTKHDFGGRDMVGHLYLPQASEPLPTVVVLGGSEGGVTSASFAAAAWANAGFASLGLAYFAEPGLPTKLKNIQLEYFERAFGMLSQHPQVDPNRIALMGTSRGGELALLLGAYFPRYVSAVIGVTPSQFLWGPSWSFRGQMLPHIIGPLSTGRLFRDGQTVLRQRDGFAASLHALGAHRAYARIQIEGIDGPVLFVAGEDDQIWPAADFVREAMLDLKAAGRTGDEMQIFSEAGHFISIPGYPTTQTSREHPQFGVVFDNGGRPDADAHASREFWTKAKAFLREHLTGCRGDILSLASYKRR